MSVTYVCICIDIWAVRSEAKIKELRTNCEVAVTCTLSLDYEEDDRKVQSTKKFQNATAKARKSNHPCSLIPSRLKRRKIQSTAPTPAPLTVLGPPLSNWLKSPQTTGFFTRSACAARCACASTSGGTRERGAEDMVAVVLAEAASATPGGSGGDGGR